MKAIKRIIAVVLFIVVAALVGYLVYTGSRLTAINGTETKSETRSVIYYDYGETQKNL